MKTPQENLMDAIGEVNDRHVMLATGITAGGELSTDVREIKVIEVEQPVIRKSHKVRNAIIGGAAAAVAIAGGLFAWSRLRPIPTEPQDPAQSSTTAAITEPVTYDTPMRALKWGMSVSEVKAVETAELSEEETNEYGTTTLIYNDIPIKEYNSRMELSFGERLGLEGINYYILSKDYEAIYDKLREELIAAYGEPTKKGEEYDGIGESWDFPEEGLTIYLNKSEYLDDTGGGVQFAYWMYLSDEAFEKLEKLRNGDNAEETVNDGRKYIQGNATPLGQTAFMTFDRYFYGRWAAENDQSGEKILDLTYTGDSFAWNTGYHLTGITDWFDQYYYDAKDLFITIETDGSGYIVLRIPLDEPDTLYEYVGVEWEGKDKDDWDAKFTKLPVEGGDDNLNVFGMADEESSNKFNIFGMAKADNGDLIYYGALPIDTGLDCEKILLDDAEALKELIHGYCGLKADELQYSLGDRHPTFRPVEGSYKVISDEVHSVDDVLDKFSDSIDPKYASYIVSDDLADLDGELYRCDPYSGSADGESWYLGYDVAGDEITGHFALINFRNLEGQYDEVRGSDVLNNKANYQFYDITVQNIDGNYVITDCRILGENGYQCPRIHGLYYDAGLVDRSLITNPEVMPRTGKGIPESDFTADEQKEIQRFLRAFSDFKSVDVMGGGDAVEWTLSKQSEFTYPDNGETEMINYYKCMKYTTFAEMKAAMSKYMTDNYISTLDKWLNTAYKEIDGELYAAGFLGDGERPMPGIDYVYIESAERFDGGIMLNMHAYGDSEHWGDLYNAKDVHFTVKLVSTPEGFKVDEYNDDGLYYLEYFYSISGRDRF